MSLKIEKKGYMQKELDCPNCGGSLILYLDEKEVVRKAAGAKLLEDGKIECHYCEAVLSYHSVLSQATIGNSK